MPEDVQPPVRLWRTLRELPRPAIVLLFGVAVNRMGSLVQIFLILYLTRIGFSPAQAGLALTAYGAGSIAGVFASGPVSDRIGPRLAIVVAMAGSGVLVAVLPFVRAYAVIAALCLSAGAIAQLYRPAALAMLASLVPANRLIITSAAYRLGLNVGVTLAPLLGVLLATYSYTLVFITDAATSVVFAGVALLALPSTRPNGARERAGEVKQEQTGYRALLSDRHFMIVLGAMLAVALAEIQYQAVLPLQIEARRLPTVLYAAVLTINGVMVILLELPLTVYIQKLPIRVSIAGGCALIGFGISLFGLPAGAWIFLAGAVIWTIGEIVSAPSTSAYPALVAPPQLRSRYIAAMNTSQTLGYAAGPSLGTIVYQFTGSWMWLMCLMLGALAGFGMWTGVTAPESSRNALSASSQSHEPRQAEA